MQTSMPSLAYEADPQAMQFIGDGSAFDREHAAETLAGFLAEWPRLGHGRWTVALQETGAVIGNCGFVRWREGEPDGAARAGLWHACVRRWGRGYATEAARAAIDWAFATLTVRGDRGAHPLRQCRFPARAGETRLRPSR